MDSLVDSFDNPLDGRESFLDIVNLSSELYLSNPSSRLSKLL